jgi:DNA-binding NarL/FixJ family response regulator
MVAKNPQYAMEAIDDRIGVLDHSGFGGYAKLLEIAQARLNENMQPDSTVRLTAAELKILRDLACGLTPKVIAAEMGRSVLTVQTHIKNVIGKLGCRGREEAIITARRLGLVDEGRS